MNGGGAMAGALLEGESGPPIHPDAREEDYNTEEELIVLRLMAKRDVESLREMHQEVLTRVSTVATQILGGREEASNRCLLEHLLYGIMRGSKPVAQWILDRLRELGQEPPGEPPTSRTPVPVAATTAGSTLTEGLGPEQGTTEVALVATNAPKRRRSGKGTGGTKTGDGVPKKGKKKKRKKAQLGPPAPAQADASPA